MRKTAVRLVAVILAALLVWPSIRPASASGGNGNGKAADVWAELLSQPAEQRQQAYLQMKLDVSRWEPGLVLASKPLVVVTAAPAAEADARVRIWTGKLSRVGDDLVATWDEAWFGTNGAASFAIADMDGVIPGYFAAPSQGTYRSLAYAGVYPWVDVPTDREAELAGKSPVPADGLINWYGTPDAARDADVVNAPQVEPIRALPVRLREKPAFPDLGEIALPADAQGHWAKDGILALMRKGVVSGYEDGTIRPEKTVSRAEFAVLLLASLQLKPAAGDVSSYDDMRGHWAARVVGAAERLGLLPNAGPGNRKFLPGEPILRQEMAVWIARALPLIGREVPVAGSGFKDTRLLDETAREAVGAVAAAGLMSGYPDGSFRPERQLTRAEAFLVAARLTDW